MATTATLSQPIKESTISALFNKHRKEDNTYYLKGLQTYVTLDENQFIRDAGFVPDMVEHTKEVLEELDQPYDNEYVFNMLKLNSAWQNSNMYGGSFFMIEFTNGSIELVLRYILNRNPIKNFITQGHEEIHATDALKKPVLEHMITRFKHNPVNLKELHPEVRAQIGGLLALKIRNIPLYHNMRSIFEGLNYDYRQWTEEAFEILY